MSKKIIVYFVMSILILISLFAGCTSSDHSLVFDGRVRTYLLHLPPQYGTQSSLPLVIALHGGGGNAENIEKTSGLSEKADKEGFIVVYPNGCGKLPNQFLTWNAGFCCRYSIENNIDDVSFIRALIQKLQQTLKIDPHRIYVTGISNGGLMTYLVASELSDIIAAAAPVAASIGGNATEDSPLWVIPEPSQPIPMMIFHGMKDRNIPYDGGVPPLELNLGAYSYVSVNDSVLFWVEHNHCSPVPQINVSNNGNIIRKTYGNGDQGSEVILYTIVDGTHAWPGGKPAFQGADEPTMDISATDLMWEFFMEHPKQ